MWFWQRREVWFGISMQEFNRFRGLLTQSGIDYDYTMNNRQRLDFDRQGASPGRWTGFRSRHDSRFDTIYYLYVSKSDYDRAKSVLGAASPQK